MVVLLLQFSHLFDNESTVFFAIFMGIWGEYKVSKRVSIVLRDLSWTYPIVSNLLYKLGNWWFVFILGLETALE